jgi:hypothetical protein
MCLALVNEIASDQKKCQCVLWYADFKSIVTVQHNFQRAYEQKHILAISFTRYFAQLTEMGSVDSRNNREGHKHQERLR